ncbi:MAG: hypothetical protein J2P48_19815, partial [Alphaproteobacteria bacterium]|nr:hypothetical protein [Alphaproteobacteria bacterium]
MTRTAHQTVLNFRWAVDLALTVASHGWVHLAPWQWDPQAGRLARRERLGPRVGIIAVTQRDPVGAIVDWNGFGAADETAVLGRVSRWLSADWEPSMAITALPDAAVLIKAGGGRMLRGSTFHE